MVVLDVPTMEKLPEYVRVHTYGKNTYIVSRLPLQLTVGGGGLLCGSGVGRGSQWLYITEWLLHFLKLM